MNEKNVNIDFIKVISMYMIIFLHLITMGGSINNSTYNGLNYFVFYLLMILTFVCVNLFALVSGYLMIDKKIKLKNLMNLWVKTLFFSILIGGVGYLLLRGIIEKQLVINSLFPLTRNQYWYFSSYFGLYLMIPYLNRMILTLSKKEMQMGIFIINIFGFLSLIFRGDPFKLNLGYSMIWLIFTYFMGAYIKRFVNISTIDRKKILKKYLFVNLLLFLITAFISLFYKGNFIFPKLTTLFIAYSSPFIIFSSIFLFELILSLQIKNKIFIKTILFLSPITFSIYLISTHPIVFRYIIKDIMKSYANKNILISLLALVVISISIFVICCIIDLLRAKLFNLLKIPNKVNSLSDNIELKIKYFLNETN